LFYRVVQTHDDSAFSHHALKYYIAPDRSARPVHRMVQHALNRLHRQHEPRAETPQLHVETPQERGLDRAQPTHRVFGVLPGGKRFELYPQHAVKVAVQNQQARWQGL
jgi:hypothetical protein